MGEFELWVYRGLIAVLVLIASYFIRKFADRVTDKLDEMITAMNLLSEKNVTNESRITRILDQQLEHTKRLNGHGERIRKVEIEHAKGCNHKDKE